MLRLETLLEVLHLQPSSCKEDVESVWPGDRGCMTRIMHKTQLTAVMVWQTFYLDFKPSVDARGDICRVMILKVGLEPHSDAAQGTASLLFGGVPPSARQVLPVELV